MEASYLQRHPQIKDALSFILFIVFVFVGTVLINSFIFRSFSVSGHSMDNTLNDGDRLIVNRLPMTAAQIKNKAYSPERGQIIVFKNPRFIEGAPDEYIVKRVIAFAGERVTVKNGVLTVYSKDNPNGFNPDESYQKDGVGPQSPVSGEGLDTVVADGTIFVCGDNRIDSHSYDSRSGLGTIPTFDIVGPVSLRIWPITAFGVPG
ncbi:MAG: signal peptidase I [Candidatus Saccharimonas sp.]|jgi:signal peptidase I|nr:signal peptidase I [Candidatus Saccharimonas sp.]